MTRPFGIRFQTEDADTNVASVGEREEVSNRIVGNVYFKTGKKLFHTFSDMLTSFFLHQCDINLLLLKNLCAAHFIYIGQTLFINLTVHTVIKFTRVSNDVQW